MSIGRRVMFAALVAPFAVPLLSATAAWMMLNLTTHKAELSQWVRFDDLWTLFLAELVVAQLITWCIGYPVFRRAQSRNAVSGTDMCVAGGAAGSGIFLFGTAVASIPSGLSWAIFVAGAMGAVNGIAVAALFSVLAGIPRSAAHSMLLQCDVMKADA